MNGSARKMMAAGAAILIGMFSGEVLAADSGTAPAQAPAAHATPAPAMHHMNGHKHAASQRVKAIQEALNREGAKVDVDGYMGRHTRAALKSFQSAHGLKATGDADAKTLQALGVKGGKKAS